MLGLAALIILGSVVAFFVMVGTADAVSARYQSMSVAIEDACELATSETDCQAYAACYLDGLEGAFPREVMAQVVEQGRAYTIPLEVDAAVLQLERDCGAQVGLNIVGG